MRQWRRKTASLLCVCMLLNLVMPAYGAGWEAPMKDSWGNGQTPSDVLTESDADDGWMDEELEDDVTVSSDSDWDDTLSYDMELEPVTLEFEWRNLVDGFPKLESVTDGNLEDVSIFPMMESISSYSVGVDGYYGAQLDPEAEAYYQLLVDYYENIIAGGNPEGKIETGEFPFEEVEDVSAYQAALLDREAFYVYQAIAAFRYDFPEMFWEMNLSTGASTSYRQAGSAGLYSGTVAMSINITNTFGGASITNAEICDQAEAMQEAMEAIDVSDETISGRLQSIHDALCDMAVYDDTLEKPYSHSAYGILVEGTAVCEGYAKAFKAMCDSIGVPCVLVIGTGGSSSQGYEAHMWNYVQMEDGNWYAVDVTWDDQDDQIFYDFFLVGSETVAEYFGGETFGAMHQESYVKVQSGLGTYEKEFYYPELQQEKYAPAEEETVVITGNIAAGSTVTFSTTETSGFGNGIWEVVWILDGKEVEYFSTLNTRYTIPEDAAGKSLQVGIYGGKNTYYSRIYVIGEAVPDEEVYIPDEALKQALSAYDFNGDGILTKSEMAEITELVTENLGIADLTGLEAAVNLQWLIADLNEISDLTPIQNLYELRYFDFSGNRITDLSLVAGLTNLIGFCVNDNLLTEIPDLNGLAGLELYRDIHLEDGSLASQPIEMFVGNQIPRENLAKNLASNPELTDEWLELNSYDTTEVYIPDEALRQALSAYDSNGDGILTKGEMADISYLAAYGVGIKDLTGLETALNLRVLYLNDNQISDLTPIAGLRELAYLEVNNNRLTDIPDLSRLVNLVLEGEVWINGVATIQPKSIFVGNKIPRESLEEKMAKNLNLTDEWLELNSYNGTVVEIKDAALREVLVDRCDSDSDGVLTVSELKSLTDLFADGAGIKDLTGLEYATELSFVSLSSNQIEDMSPLAGLTKLSYLDLTGNRLTDIPDLSGLKILRMYNGYNGDGSARNIFGGNQITRDKFAGKLPQEPNEEWLVLNSYESDIVKIPDENLKTILLEYDADGDGELCRSEMRLISYLDLRNREIRSLEGLEWATQIEWLDASENMLTDVAVLGSCTRLYELNISNNQISDISALAACKDLKYLYANNNSLSEIPDFKELRSLTLYKYSEAGNAALCMFAGNKNLNAEAFTGKFLDELTDEWIELNAYDDTPVEFRDKNLTAALFEQGCDLDGDGVIVVSELACVTSLDLSGKGIVKLNGLEHARSLETLNISDNQIEKLKPLTGCIALTNLWARNNKLTELPDFAHWGIWLKIYDELLTEGIDIPRDMFSGNQLTCSALEEVFGRYGDIDEWLEINACDWGQLSVPVLYEAVAAEDGSIELWWNKQQLAEGYYVYRRTEASEWSRYADVSDLSWGSWFRDTFTVQGTTYYYTVEAYRMVDGNIETSGRDEIGISATALRNGPAENMVYFDTMGGTEVEPQSIAMGGEAVKPEPPQRTNYSFQGWYKEPEYLTEYDFGEPVYESITLYAKWQEILDLTNADAEVSGTYIYNGQEILPELIVRIGQTVLAEGEDYTVSAAAENINAGENAGKVLIIGIGRCIGSKEVEFTIGKAQMNHAVPDQKLEAAYGSRLDTIALPAPWKWENDSITVGSVGTQSHAIIYPGDKNHEDQHEVVSVTVTPRSIDGAEISLEYTETEYDATVKEPKVTAVDADGVIVPASEYKVVYSNNENAGTAVVTVTVSEDGSGNFTGSAETTFVITPAKTPDPVIVNKVYQVVYGDPLSSAQLPEGWSWQNPSQDVGDVTGTNKTFKADFKAPENSNYGDVSDVDLKVRVIAKELSDADVRLEETSFIYDGTEKKPAVAVTSGSRTLYEGTDKDYTVSYKANIEVGTAQVIVKGVNNYSGTVTKDFSIIRDPYDIGGAEVVLEPADADYTGSPIEPQATVRLLGSTLAEDTDYSVDYKDNTEPGYGKVIITGIEPYHGEKTVKFQIYPAGYELKATYGDRLSSVRLPGDWTWKTPDDYVGDATVDTEIRSFSALLTVDGETIEEMFGITVEPKDIALTDIKVTGENIVYVPQIPATPEVSVRDLALIDIKDPLTEGEDYTVTYSSNTQAGKAAVTVRGIGNYKGSVDNFFTIQQAVSVQEIKSDKINENNEILLTIKEEPFFLYASFIGDGELKFASSNEDVFTITKKKNPVTGSEDGELAVAGVGEAVLTVQVLAGENYKASEPVEYRVIVTKVPISDRDITLEKDSYEYTGSQIRPEFKVEVDGTLLVENTDYTVSFGENKNAGTGTVTVTGINDYEGQAVAEFEIARIENPAELPPEVSAVYGQKLSEIELTGGWNWKDPDQLVGGVGSKAFDIVLAETENYLEKTGTVAVTVSEKNLEDAMVELEYESVEYDGSSKEPAVTVNDGILATSEDYTVAYADNVLPGTAVVTVTAQNNYAGVVTKNFTITRGVILESHITTEGDFVYNGTQHKPEPVVTVKDRVLAKDIDYTVDSYGENIHAGEGTVTVSGIGNYTGKVTAKFTIRKAESLATPPNAVRATYGQLLKTIPLEDGWAWEDPDAVVGNAGVNKAAAFLAETADYNRKTADVTITVEPKKLTEDMVALEESEWIFDGSSKQPAVYVKDGEMLSAEDYQAAYQNNIYAGTAEVIVTGTGNYQGTVRKSFVIEKAVPVITIGAGTDITKYQNSGSFSLQADISNGGALSYVSSDPSVAAVDEAGNVAAAAAGKAVITVSYAGDDNYTSASVQVQVTIQRRSSGGSSSGSGGSSGSSTAGKKSVPAGYTGSVRVIDGVEVPSYVQQGSWFQTTDGTWRCTDSTGALITGGWRPLYNPYADLSRGQMAFDWFLFDEAGNMKTGWYVDEEGDTYYLNVVSDNTKGRMAVGWWLIDGIYYYFNEVPDGRRGRLLKNTRTPDGFFVDEKGAWVK